MVSASLCIRLQAWFQLVLDVAVVVCIALLIGGRLSIMLWLAPPLQAIRLEAKPTFGLSECWTIGSCAEAVRLMTAGARSNLWFA